jgi:hypothetical protein
MNDENSNDSNSMNTYDELLDEIGKNYMIGYTKEEINDLFNSIFNNIYIDREKDSKDSKSLYLLLEGIENLGDIIDKFEINDSNNIISTLYRYLNIEYNDVLTEEEKVIVENKILENLLAKLSYKKKKTRTMIDYYGKVVNVPVTDFELLTSNEKDVLKIQDPKKYKLLFEEYMNNIIRYNVAYFDANRDEPVSNLTTPINSPEGVRIRSDDIIMINNPATMNDELTPLVNMTKRQSSILNNRDDISSVGSKSAVETQNKRNRLETDIFSSLVKDTKRQKKGGKKNKTKKKQFLFNPNDPKKSFDVYIDKDPSDTIPIKYTTVKDVEETIKKLENLYKKGKYSHKRIWQVAMILKVRLQAMKKHKKKLYPKAKNVGKRLNLSRKYYNFLKKRTKEKDNKTRKNMKFVF